MNKNIDSLLNDFGINGSQFNTSFNTTFILLFLLFAASLIYIRVVHCACGQYKTKCGCNQAKTDIYENVTGSIGTDSEIALTPFQSKIPKEIPRPQIAIQTPTSRYQSQLPKMEAPSQTIPQTTPQTIPQTTPQTPTPQPIIQPATQPTMETRSQKDALQKPKFNWSSDARVNEELRQQVMKNIEIAKQKHINIIQTKPGTIQNLKITPETETSHNILDESSNVEPRHPAPPAPVPEKTSKTGWILLGVFGGIWCLSVIIFIIVLLVKYR
jgi:hypothetical protein